MENVALSPHKIFETIGLSKDAIVADFGCGPGFFALPAAEMTDEAVHAIDIRKEMLDVCANEAHTKNLKNLHVVHADLERIEGSDLSDGSVDLVIMRRIITQNEHKNRLFQEAYRVLHQGGVLLIIGFSERYRRLNAGQEYVDRVDVLTFASDAGFDQPDEFLVNSDHFGLLFKK